jgi:hypothetical protein
VRLRERFGARRARHLAVQGHDVAAPVPEGGECFAVGLGGGDPRCGVPAWRFFLSADLETMRWAHRPRSRDVNPEALAAKPGDHPLGISRWHATAGRPVPGCHGAVAHPRAREYHRGPPCVRGRLPVSPVDRVHVMSVDHIRVPAESSRPLQIPSQHDLAGVTRPVHVDDHGQVVQGRPAAAAECLPGRVLCHLRVPAQHPDPGGQPV